MKKVLMLVLVMWAAGAYSQEIRMPDEKRKDYVDERGKTNTTSDSVDQRDIDAERKRRAELARKQRAEASKEKQATKGILVYSIIRERTDMKGTNPKVTIHLEESFEGWAKRADEASKKSIMVAMEKKAYPSGLDALSSFTQLNWSLVETSVYSMQETTVREYLMVFELPIR